MNKYGIVSYPALASSGSVTEYAASGTPKPITPDFYNLQRYSSHTSHRVKRLTVSSQWDTLTPTGVSLAAYTPTERPPKCPVSTSGGWTVNANAPLPTIKDLVIPSKTLSVTAVSTSNGQVVFATQSPAAVQTSSRLSTGAKIGVGVVVVGSSRMWQEMMVEAIYWGVAQGC